VNIVKRSSRFLLCMGLLLLGSLSAMAGTDATEIVTAASSAFDLVAPLVISIAVFFIVLSIVKKVRRA